MSTLMRKCMGCKWEWAKRRGVAEPSRCPACHTVCWNRERRKAGRPKAAAKEPGAGQQVREIKYETWEEA